LQVVFLGVVPENSTVITLSADGLVQIWKYTMADCRCTLFESFNTANLPVVAALMSNRLCVVEVVSQKNIVSIYDYSSQLRYSHRVEDDHLGVVFSVIVNAKLRIFASAEREGLIKFWDDQNVLVGEDSVEFY
jgi:WD40 repeat protein